MDFKKLDLSKTKTDEEYREDIRKARLGIFCLAIAVDASIFEDIKDRFEKAINAAEELGWRGGYSEGFDAGQQIHVQ